jgi:hypothetical protein
MTKTPTTGTLRIFPTASFLNLSGSRDQQRTPANESALRGLCAYFKVVLMAKRNARIVNRDSSEMRRRSVKKALRCALMAR